VIAIVDYGMGNLRSVEKAFHLLGHAAGIAKVPDAVRYADGVVLPGVGAFARAMENLAGRGFDRVLRDVIREGKPFLGICLGLQLLFKESEEFGRVRGLGVIPGRVIRFAGPQFTPPEAGAPAPLKVPHMGWNSIAYRDDIPHFQGVPPSAMFYFVHSYHGVPEDESWIAATTHHGIEFVSAVRRENIFASQFHPEKSGAVGLQVLKNFAELVHGASAPASPPGATGRAPRSETRFPEWK